MLFGATVQIESWSSPEVPKLLHLAPPQDFALIYAPREKHKKYYIWNINNLILLERPSSNT
jgi:hypothetical protein